MRYKKDVPSRLLPTGTSGSDPGIGLFTGVVFVFLGLVFLAMVCILIRLLFMIVTGI